jgi:hypothetical protein
LIPRDGIGLANQRHDDGAPPTAEVAPIRKIGARGGVEMLALGLGTWTMGERHRPPCDNGGRFGRPNR